MDPNTILTKWFEHSVNVEYDDFGMKAPLSAALSKVAYIWAWLFGLQ
jgi:hypothetical protein